MSSLPRVLLVEDEALIRLILAELLEDAGFEVVSAASADAASALPLDGREIDLLITDIQTPGTRDGLVLARELRARWPALPVLFTTGRPQAMAPYGPLGPRDAFIAKPFGPRELLETARRLVRS